MLEKELLRSSKDAVVSHESEVEKFKKRSSEVVDGVKARLKTKFSSGVLNETAIATFEDTTDLFDLAYIEIPADVVALIFKEIQREKRSGADKLSDAFLALIDTFYALYPGEANQGYFAAIVKTADLYLGAYEFSDFDRQILKYTIDPQKDDETAEEASKRIAVENTVKLAVGQYCTELLDALDSELFQGISTSEIEARLTTSEGENADTSWRSKLIGVRYSYDYDNDFEVNRLHYLTEVNLWLHTIIHHGDLTCEPTRTSLEKLFGALNPNPENIKYIKWNKVFELDTIASGLDIFEVISKITDKKLQAELRSSAITLACHQPLDINPLTSAQIPQILAYINFKEGWDLEELMETLLDLLKDNTNPIVEANIRGIIRYAFGSNHFVDYIKRIEAFAVHLLSGNALKIRQVKDIIFTNLQYQQNHDFIIQQPDDSFDIEGSLGFLLSQQQPDGLGGLAKVVSIDTILAGLCISNIQYVTSEVARFVYETDGINCEQLLRYNERNTDNFKFLLDPKNSVKVLATLNLDRSIKITALLDLPFAKLEAMFEDDVQQALADSKFNINDILKLFNNEKIWQCVEANAGLSLEQAIGYSSDATYVRYLNHYHDFVLANRLQDKINVERFIQLSIYNEQHGSRFGTKDLLTLDIEATDKIEWFYGPQAGRLFEKGYSFADVLKFVNKHQKILGRHADFVDVIISSGMDIQQDYPEALMRKFFQPEARFCYQIGLDIDFVQSMAFKSPIFRTFTARYYQQGNLETVKNLFKASRIDQQEKLWAFLSQVDPAALQARDMSNMFTETAGRLISARRLNLTELVSMALGNAKEQARFNDLTHDNVLKFLSRNPSHTFTSLMGLRDDRPDTFGMILSTGRLTHSSSSHSSAAAPSTPSESTGFRSKRAKVAEPTDDGYTSPDESGGKAEKAFPDSSYDSPPPRSFVRRMSSGSGRRIMAAKRKRDEDGSPGAAL